MNAQVRKRRAEEAAKKDAAKAALDSEKAAAESKSGSKSGKKDSGLTAWTSIQIKKMKPEKIKDELELRGLSKQGNKNEIMQRLLDACAAESS